MFSIGFSYSRHQGMSKTDECNLCRNTIDLSILSERRLRSRFKVEINGTAMNVFEQVYSCYGGLDRDRLNLIYSHYDACPVDLRPWENGSF